MVESISLHRIRAFYAAYFAAMGLLLPFFPVFLDARGLAAGQVGLLVGLLAAAKVVAPPVIGALLDGRGAQDVRRFIVFSSLMAGMLVWLLQQMDALWSLAAIVFLFGFLWAAVLPLTDGLSVSISEAALVDYGRLRVWGSLGFIAASLAGGIWFSTRLDDFPLWLAMLMLAMAWAARRFPAPPPAAPERGGIRPMPWAMLGWLLLAGFLMQASHGAYYGFFSLYLADAGYAQWQVGGFWVLGVLAEVVLMWCWSGFLQRQVPRNVFVSCLLLAAVRWAGMALGTHWLLLGLLQCLHAASFAAFHIAAVTWIGRMVPPGRQSSAQGWYSAMGFGLGGTLGIMGAGWIVESMGYMVAFLVCAALALLALPAAWRVSRRSGPRSD
ncbi:MAG: MFS transporter [Zetaproteobacteria bacterium]|nr:MAG: MFS transporter [Zetaproteobacteria bacterium]